jgi:phosphoglycolate phosphatase-like HAD superfamily hydrolase
MVFESPAFMEEKWLASDPPSMTTKNAIIEKINRAASDISSIETTSATLAPVMLAKYFETIRGIGMDEPKVEKDVVISRVMSEYNLSPADTVMVGDRCFDIDGAHKNGIECAAVLFGYGNEAEFKEYGADYIVDTYEDLFNFIKGIA